MSDLFAIGMLWGIVWGALVGINGHRDIVDGKNIGVWLSVFIIGGAIGCVVIASLMNAKP